MTKKEEIMAIFLVKYDAWVESQKGQTDAYEHERSFDEFMQQAGRELLQGSVGGKTDNRKKNDTHQVWGN